MLNDESKNAIKKSKRARIMQIVAFVIVFIVLFIKVQQLLCFRFDKEYCNYAEFEKLDKVDMVFVGTSELWCGVVPMEIYDRTGIVSYNLSHSWKASPMFYREVEYIIKNNNPKYIIMDFSSLFSNTLPSDSKIYRCMLYSIPDIEIKLKILKDIYDLDRTEFLSYLFPIIQFHDTWSQETINFEKKPKYKDIMVDYRMGWNNRDDLIHDEPQPEGGRTIVNDMWEPIGENKAISDFDRLYYDKIIDLCSYNGIQIIAVIPPKYGDAETKTLEWDATEQYLNEHGIRYLNYNTYDFAKENLLDWNDEYNDANHLNYVGAIKWSGILADDLLKMGIIKESYENDGEYIDELEIMLDEYLNHYKELGVK